MSSRNTDQVRWGFLGAGFIASRALAPAVHASEHASLRSVAARDAERARGLEPVGLATEDYRAVLADDSVEAVYISLTNEAHLTWIIAALAAGKHVLCEKPITMDADECRTAFAAARDAGLLLVEAAWTQWHPRSRHVDAFVATGDLGDVRTIRASFTFNGVPPDNYRLDPARGGGSLLDLGPYLVRPVATWAAGDWRVDAAARTTSENGTDLRTNATLMSSPDLIAEINSSFVDPEQQAMSIEGSAASITYGSPAVTSWRESATVEISEGSRVWSETFPVCDAYELMVSAVSRRIRGDLDAYVIHPEESMRCMELIDLIDTAARTS